MDKEYRNEKGEFHREDGPAFISVHGDKIWWINDKLHREDGPAIIRSDGTQEWYLNGKRHRENGSAIIFGNDQAWYLNGELHRENGPAIIDINNQIWYLNGKLHREDGPAIIRSDGTQEWYFEDREVTEEWISKYQKLIKKHTLLGVPVRDKWRVGEIVLSWYYNPKLNFVKNRLEKECKELYL